MDEARRLMRCLSTVVRLRSAGAGRGASREGASLSAERMVIEGLRIEGRAPLGEAVVRCRAERIVVEGAVLRYPGGGPGASGSVRGSRMVLGGPVEVMAGEVEGRLLGLLPIMLSGREHSVVPVPPLTIPWLELTDVRISDLVLHTKEAHISGAVLSIARLQPVGR
ncbi:hypothetical protein OG897_30255 [Streptomyces sp. NBC_00237]|uniref:hypothetical protein n=1 Tax=Streptomyces sp. NBC_00237 TaxID=2975687 RepID=UPI002259A133|nr:hypothetical protein [Streptomyces sp. NBC_00237]MCX5205722.1 hypothetical protein [Streptomyces sp. NBC_00237]